MRASQFLRMLKSGLTRETGRYGLVTAAGFVIDLAIALFSHEILGLPLPVAVTVGFFTAAVANYMAHEFWTFADHKAEFSGFRLSRYLAVALVTLSVRWLIISLFAGLELPPPQTTILLSGAAIGSLGVNYFLTKGGVFVTETDRRQILSTRFGQIVFAIFSAITITWSFQTDHFRVTEDLARPDYFSDGLVYGRLIRAEQEGVFSNSGLMGRVHDPELKQGTDSGLERSLATIEMYKTGSDADKEEALATPQGIYTGNIGLQSWFLYIVDQPLKLFGLSAAERVITHQNLIRLLTALTLAFILSLAYREFGLVPSLTGLCLIAAAPWLNTFSESVYWVPFTWFLPIAVCWFAFVDRDTTRENLAPRFFFILLFFALLMRVGAGFEYVTTILVVCGALSIYRPLTHGNWLKVFKQGALTSAVCLSAVITGIVAQILIISSHTGSIDAAISDYFERVSKRSATGGTQGSPAEDLAILPQYLLDQPVIEAPWPSISAAGLLAMTFIIIMLSVVIITIRGKMRYKVASTFFFYLLLLLAPISWFVLASGHSGKHFHINYVIWHLTWGFMSAIVATYLIGQALDKMKLKSVIGFTSIILLLSVSSLYLVYMVKSYRAISGNEIWAQSSAEEIKLDFFRDRILIDLPCRQISSEHTFFLHLYTNPRNYLVQNKPKPRVNADFEFDVMALPRLPFASRCKALVPYEGFSVSEVHIGQYDKEAFVLGEGNGRVWSQRADVTHREEHSTIVKRELLNEGNWVNGVDQEKNTIFVKHTPETRAVMATASAVRLPDGSHMQISGIRYFRRFINLTFEEQAPKDLAEEIQVVLETEN
ncbi:MAG: GtrA family protein [Aquisalinus sp.]|nr:GtrA family protein [Aquisalinus sp.]